MGPLGMVLGTSGSLLELSWSRHEASWSALGAVLRPLGPLLEPSWGLLEPSWGSRPNKGQKDKLFWNPCWLDVRNQNHVYPAPKRRPCWRPTYFFAGGLASSKKLLLLDPLKNMVVLISGSKIVILQCKCVKSQHGRFWENLVFPVPRQGHVGLQTNFFGGFCESQDEVMLGPHKIDVR